ncbi:MAG: type II toxin-antitoxin system VapC family toxin [Chloroflexi bacterium]|nr:type II toxin-antitoxin system VapC family toxin [Chloroflexota bacterium]
MSSLIVVDASVAIWTLLPAMAPVDAVGRLIAWRQANAELYAPLLWLAECVSAIRRYVYAGLITSQEGLTAIDDLMALEVTVVPMTHSHCRAAYIWAERLGQSRAYDGFYLALTEELGGTFFTGDKRLINGAQQLGLSWVQWIGD